MVTKKQGDEASKWSMPRKGTKVIRVNVRVYNELNRLRRLLMSKYGHGSFSDVIIDMICVTVKPDRTASKFDITKQKR